MNAYTAAEEELNEILKLFPGTDSVTVFIRTPKCMKKIKAGIKVNEESLDVLKTQFGADNIAVR